MFHLNKKHFMKFNPKTIQLKNNETISIRICKTEDAENLIKTVKTYLADSEYIPKNSTEFNVTLEQEKSWIKTFLDNENSLLLVAVNGNQIIGNLGLTGGSREAMKHTAVVGMGILKEWRNVGVGTELMKAAIDWAKSNPILELIHLQVYTENKCGISLYKKIGFEENGMLKNYFKQNDTYYDMLTMSLEVK
jgi:RimJ/RimL family protein N-acetyltransferase